MAQRGLLEAREIQVYKDPKVLEGVMEFKVILVLVVKRVKLVLRGKEERKVILA
jgi:hypothetical protein